MSEFNYSLSEIKALCKQDPSIAGMFQRKLAASKDIFIKQLYCDIDNAIQVLEQNKHFYQDPKWGEDELTISIINYLKACNYEVEHDTQHGGHIDMLVKHTPGKYEWIGEAKIWDGPKYIYDGWIQLTERYGTGSIRDDHGGIIIYVKGERSLKKFNDWKAYLTNEIPDIEIEAEESPLRFKSVSPHPATDLPYYVRHMVVSLYHFTGKK